MRAGEVRHRRWTEKGDALDKFNKIGNEGETKEK